jgi:preprotein translocase subunit SecG
MFTILLFLHILVAVFLVVVILLQSGQGAAISSAFGGGGGGNQTLFGGRGAASFLTRATTYLGAGFLVLSFALAYVQAHQHATGATGRNIIQENLRPSQQAAPSQGAEGAGAPAETPAAGAPSQAPLLPAPTPAPAGGTSGGK